MKRWGWLFLLIIVAVTAAWFGRVALRDWWFEIQKPALPEAVEYRELIERTERIELIERTERAELTEETELTERMVPKSSINSINSIHSVNSINLAVPFTPQAPHGVWDAVHEETCEEAAVLMVDAFFDGRALAPDSVEAELLALVDWQKQRFGYFEDTTVAEVAIIAREYYGYQNVEVRYDITVADIEAVVRSNLPVIVPLDGRTIGNPFYSGEGPDYHMMVIRGLTKDGKFITNDPGTRRGEAYVYDSQVLWEAIYDWNGGSGPRRKAMIVVHP